jgi:hypothetical protein
MSGRLSMGVGWSTSIEIRREHVDGIDVVLPGGVTFFRDGTGRGPVSGIVVERRHVDMIPSQRVVGELLPSRRGGSVGDTSVG